MVRTMLMTAASALALAFASPALAETKVKDVDVQMDLSAIQNEKAAAYWTTAADDLKAAIAARVAERTADDGATIQVDIDELSVANWFETAFNMDQSELKGHVLLMDNGTHLGSYDVSVKFADAILLMPEGTDVAVIAPDNKDYYQAMVNKFADAVVAQLG
jgi:hypothetical protein